MTASKPAGPTGATATRTPLIMLSWLWVGLPFAYGVYKLIDNVGLLFK
jgi:hypothetical protein